MHCTWLVRRCLVILLAGATWAGCVARPRGPLDPDKQPGQVEQAPYVFTLDGVPYTPQSHVSLDGSGRLKPGDVVRIDGWQVTLGPLRRCHFVTTCADGSDARDRLLLKLPDHTRRVVALAVPPYPPPDGGGIGGGRLIGGGIGEAPRTPVKPPEPLTPEQINGLWGILIRSWSPDVRATVKHVDPARVCITIYAEAAQGPTAAIPPLPTTIRYLHIETWGPGDKIEDLSYLSKLKDLQFFDCMTHDGKDLDWSALAACRNLRHARVNCRYNRDIEILSGLGELGNVDIWGSLELTSIHGLTKLKGLRRLRLENAALSDLSVFSSLPNLEVLRVREIMRAVGIGQARLPANGMPPRLRELHMHGPDIHDLTPLEGLQDLELLDITYSVVEKLPRRDLPKLREIRASNSRITDLTPLANFPSIQVVVVDLTRTLTLPKGRVPTLRRLHIVGANVSSQAAADFAANNPQCAVHHKPMDALRRE